MLKWTGAPAGMLVAAVPLAFVPVLISIPVTQRLALSSSAEEFELAADDLALKMLEKSSISSQKYFEFWVRFANVDQESSFATWNFGGVHPVSQERLKRLAERAAGKAADSAQSLQGDSR